MFFISFRIFFKIAAASPSGKVKMPNNAAIKSAARYPSFNSQGLTAQK